MHLKTIAITTSIVVGLPMVASKASEVPDARPIQPCLVISGCNSRVTQTRYRRIVSATEWTRIWQEHKGADVTEKYDSFYDELTLPLVDFDRYMVIAIFQGKGWNSAGLTVVSSLESESRIVIRFKEKSYQTDGGVDNVASYAFLIMSRSNKPVVLEESVRDRKGQAPTWKERASLSGL
jgi:hypothetical protein